VLGRGFEHLLIAHGDRPVVDSISGEDLIAGPVADAIHSLYAELAVAQTVSPAHSALAQIPQSEQKVGEILHAPPNQGEPEVVCRSSRMPARERWVEYEWPGDITLLSQHLHSFRRAAVVEEIINT